jgi:hypothetical protein
MLPRVGSACLTASQNAPSAYDKIDQNARFLEVAISSRSRLSTHAHHYGWRHTYWAMLFHDLKRRGLHVDLGRFTWRELKMHHLPMINVIKTPDFSKSPFGRTAYFYPFTRHSPASHMLGNICFIM